jgi:hypothetical protein
VIEKAVNEKPTLEHIFDKVIEAKLFTEEARKIYPPNLFRYGCYGLIVGFTASLDLGVPAELTADGWRTP